MIIVIEAGGVIGIALHQHQLRIDLQDGMHGALHFADVRGTSGDEKGLTLGGHAFQSFDPIDLTRTGFIHLDILIEHVNGLEIIWGGEEIDPHIITGLF